MLPTALIFHGQPQQRARLRAMLADHFAVSEAHTVEDLWRRLSNGSTPQLLFVQLLLPKRKGLELIRLIRRRANATEIIVVSPIETPAYAMDAAKAGAFGFLSQDDGAESILATAYEALERGEPRSQPRQQQHAASPLPTCSSSTAMQHVLQQLDALSHNDEHVLLLGEVGTGRKTLARALHTQAGHGGVLRIIDCAQCEQDSLLSTLQIAGPCRGSSDPKRPPVRNTLMLLNIERWGHDDRKALEDLQRGPVLVRLTHDAYVPIRYRVIAVANAPNPMPSHGDSGDDRLQTALAESLSATMVNVPPLRQRMPDLPALCEQLCAEWADKYGVPAKQLSSGALEILTTYGWPGNILELRNLIERLTLLHSELLIDESMIPMEIHIGGWRRGLTYRQAMEQMERRFLQQVLNRVGGCRRRAAERLQVSYSTLKFRLRKLRSTKEHCDTSTDIRGAPTPTRYAPTVATVSRPRQQR